MNKKILIVDDEKEIVDLLEVYLSNDGYSVYKCYNGLEAMKCIKQSQIDLAILDIMLPDMDGYEVLQAVQEYDEKFGKSFTSLLLCLPPKLRIATRLWGLRLVRMII